MDGGGDAPVEVWWSLLSAADRRLGEVLTVAERARADSLLRPADRGRSLLGAALLRAAVGEHLGVGPEQVRLERTCAGCGEPHGAPRVLGPGAPVPWTSLSHSGLLVAVALSPHGPVGVDVQRVSDLPDGHPAAEWVRREAVVKVSAARPAGGSAASSPTVLDDRDADGPRPPLPGYAAALATSGRVPDRLVARRWPGLDGGG